MFAAILRMISKDNTLPYPYELALRIIHIANIPVKGALGIIVKQGGSTFWNIHRVKYVVLKTEVIARQVLDGHRTDRTGRGSDENNGIRDVVLLNQMVQILPLIDNAAFTGTDEWELDDCVNQACHQ